MNVLILTPDAVGSTLLQRLITIYMNFHQYDRPVINLHELTNGISKYYNSKFNQEVLGKHPESWGYHQSLEQIVELLKSVDHYKVSRLAQYHINSRRDSMADQIPFYRYLNENFYIISCRRHNLFEHALSWGLNKVTNKLNVYTPEEKIDGFFNLYNQGVDLDPNSIVQTLYSYREYLSWCNNHFDIANYFYYEEHLPCIEQYILNLPIFPQQTPVTWKQKFGLSFDQWNMCHYLTSDLGTLALSHPEQFSQLANENKQLNFEKGATDKPVVIKNKLLPALINLLPETHQNFINQHNQTYQLATDEISTMVNNKILVGTPPIKKQTLSEKKHMIRNYQNLLNVYNQWIEKNPEMGKPLDLGTLDQFAEIEQNRWNPAISTSLSTFQQSND